MAESPKIDRRPTTAAAETRGYERSTLPVRPLLLIAGGTAVLLAVLFVGVRWFEQRITARPAADEMRVMRSDENDTPVAPPLQPQRGHDALDAWDLQAMRANDNKVFERLGWTPRSDGTGVSVPSAVVDEVRRRQQTIATTQTGGAR